MTAPDSTPSWDFEGAHEIYNNLDSPYPESRMTSASISVQSLVGKRCLLRVGSRGFSGNETQEFHVLEVSPSGNFLHLRNACGNKFWRSAQDISFVEELRDLKAERLADIGR